MFGFDQYFFLRYIYDKYHKHEFRIEVLHPNAAYKWLFSLISLILDSFVSSLLNWYG